MASRASASHWSRLSRIIGTVLKSRLGVNEASLAVSASSVLGPAGTRGADGEAAAACENPAAARTMPKPLRLVRRALMVRYSIGACVSGAHGRVAGFSQSHDRH